MTNWSSEFGCVHYTPTDIIMRLQTSGEMYVLEWNEPNRWNKRLIPCLVTSKKPPEVKKGLPDQCETILLPCKSRTMYEWQRMSRDKSRLCMVNLNEEAAKGYVSPLAHMAMPKQTPHWINLQ